MSAADRLFFGQSFGGESRKGTEGGLGKSQITGRAFQKPNNRKYQYRYFNTSFKDWNKVGQKGFIKRTRLEVLRRGWNLKISCGAIYSISSAWNPPAAPFNLNFSRLWSMAVLQFVDRSKTGLCLLQQFFSGVLKWICSLLSYFLFHWFNSIHWIWHYWWPVWVWYWLPWWWSYAATASQADPSPHQIIQRLFMNPPSLSPPTARGYELCHPHHLAGRWEDDDEDSAGCDSDDVSMIITLK